MSPGLKTEFFEQMSMDFCADLKNWTALLLATDDVPLVHSVSYGWQGNLSQVQCTPDKTTAIDADYAKLAARGITIIFASGDSGSGYAPPHPPAPPQCGMSPGTAGVLYDATPDHVFNLTVPVGKFPVASQCCSFASGEHYKAWDVTPLGPSSVRPGETTYQCSMYSSEPSSTKPATNASAGKTPAAPPPAPPGQAVPLYPSWPASSPWVTAVGATRPYNDKLGGEEAAVSAEDHFGSGGGFSTMFDVGDWQKDAVEHYFATVDPTTLPDTSAATYPRGGRATPDVAALGTGYVLTVRGKEMDGIGGTSASAPVFAAMIALVNDARMAAGQKALGFLNPFLYQNADVFTDVTKGSDKVGRGGSPLPWGFNCSAGWDPVTGLGVPVFPKLMAAAMKAGERRA